MNLVTYNQKNSPSKRGRSGPDFFRSWFDDDLFSYIWDSALGDSDVLTTKETNEDYLIRLEVPGYNKDEIKVEVVEGILSIQGEKKENDDIWGVSGNFSKYYTLPESISIDSTSAKIEDGILLITIPKEAKESKRIKVG